MRITTVRRYPVKSMLGEQLGEARLEPAGVEHDRGFALIDATTGLVATAKHPRLWRDLLKYSSTVAGDRVLITSPAGWTLDARDPGVDERLSDGLGRPVRLCSDRPSAATVERPAPEDVLDQGVEAEVPAATLEIGGGTPWSTGCAPHAPHAVPTLMSANQVEVPGSGVLPCAGGYAEVVRPGVVRVGDEVSNR